MSSPKNPRPSLISPVNQASPNLTQPASSNFNRSHSNKSLSKSSSHHHLIPQSPTSTTASTIMNFGSPTSSDLDSYELKHYDQSNKSDSHKSPIRSPPPESTLNQYPSQPQPAMLNDSLQNSQFNTAEQSLGYSYLDPYTKEVTYRNPSSRFSTWSLDSDDQPLNTLNQTTPTSKNSFKPNNISSPTNVQKSYMPFPTAHVQHDHLNSTSPTCKPPKVRSRFGQWAHNIKDSFKIVENHSQIDIIPTEDKGDSDDELTATYANPSAVYYKANSNSPDSDDPSQPPDKNRHDLYLVKKAALRTAQAPLSRTLAPRHIQMIAFGGAIGTGLFIGTGSSLATSGPGSLLIGFAVTGIMLILTISALGELAVCFPMSGAFTTYNAKFVNLAFGTVIGYGYACQWAVSVGLELVAAAMTIGYWSDINPAVWVLIFWLLLCFINLFGVRIFGEIEFVFCIIKIVAITGFIILGIVMICGGVPNRGYLGTKYWHDPGSFSHGAKGLFTVFVNATFSYAGTELAGLTAAEAQNPRKAIPSAVKQVCWRIVLFYFVSLTVVGCLVPYTDPRLLQGANSADVRASPFVIALETAGLRGLPSVFNAAVLVAVMSVANSSVYATTRTLAALAAQGQAPKQLGYIDRNGRPIVSLIITLLFGLIGFLASSSKAADVFVWLLSISGLSCVFTWASICLCHIRFRAALKAQNRSTSELLFKAPLGEYGSMVGLALNIFVIVIVFWTSLYPIDLTGTGDGKADVYNFFSIYLCVPVTILAYIIYSFFKPSKLIKLKDIDLDTGRREVDLELIQLEIEEENRRIRDKGWLYYTYRLWC